MPLKTRGKLFTASPSGMETQVAYFQHTAAQNKQTRSNGGRNEEQQEKTGSKSNRNPAGQALNPKSLPSAPGPLDVSSRPWDSASFTPPVPLHAVSAASLLGQLLSVRAALLHRCPMSLLSSASWGSHGKLGFIFTAVFNGLSGPPCKESGPATNFPI